MINTRTTPLRKLSQGPKPTNATEELMRSTSQLKYSEFEAISSSSSHYSTCCSNSSPDNQSLRNLDEEPHGTDDPLGKHKYTDFEEILPLQLLGLRIPRITWDSFPALPNRFSQWKAHCFWTVGYTFDINMRKMKRSNNIRYRLQIHSWCSLSNRSWVKFKWDRLLEHETGHYLLGCLCALEFKSRADKHKYTKNYRMECAKIFQDTFQHYLQLERKYDEETHHSQNVAKQQEWNEFIKSELFKYA